MHWLIHLGMVLLLCQCATKHQPVAFRPYFPTRPDEILGPDQLLEMQALEADPAPTLLKQKRLWELYQIEGRQLKAGSQRLIEIAARAERLRSQLDPYFAKLAEGESRLEPAAAPKEKVPFENKELATEYARTYSAWNRDENEVAWQKVEAIAANGKWAESASPEEWTRVLNLAFRIGFDTGDRERAKLAYRKLKEYAECSEEAAQAGFVLSVAVFGAGQAAEARQILEGQCDKDTSGSNLLKRNYWLYRYGNNEAYERIRQLAVPGYYAYLSDAMQNRPFLLPKPSGLFSFETPIEMDTESAQLLTGAEECLRENLKADAVVLLKRATRRLIAKPQANLQPLLYTSRLFQAAGNHLEAMKIMSTVFTDESALQNGDSALAVDEFIQLFHRPFEEKVEWLGKLWKVDPDFVYSIMRQESAFNPGAVSIAGARGLMQLMPSLAKYLVDQWKGLKVTSPGYLMRGQENLRIAIYHLHQLQTLAPHPALMAASYNAGINRVSNWWRRNGAMPLDVFVELIPVNETRNYVKLVLRNYLYYQGLRNGGVVAPGAIALSLPPMPTTPPREVSAKK